MMCSVCKENVAVVYIAQFVDGKQTQQGLCLTCARKQNVGPIRQMMDQAGLSDEELDAMNRQMTEMLGNMESDGSNPMAGNPLMALFQNASAMDPAMFGGAHNAEDISRALEPVGAAGELVTDDHAQEREGGTSTRTRPAEKKNRGKKKFLDQFGTNLNDRAREGRIDRVVGRDREIDRVIGILNRRTKNNPVLIGEPGVGKTAIAEGLALRIAEERVPAKLLEYEVYQLDMTGLVAGTQFRGQFESRMKSLLDEARSLGNIILVIDELHNIMGAGEAEGAMNAANILKPALAKGEVQVIGATTLNEYRKYIEKDSALERRFQPVMVEEPTVEETIGILKGIRHYYEEYHKVILPDDVLVQAAVLAERYISDRFLPDKAIDVIDEAGSYANLRNDALRKIQTLEKELEDLRAQLETLNAEGSIESYRQIAEKKTHECQLEEELKQLKEGSSYVRLTTEDVARVIELWTRIPVQTVTEVEAQKLVALEDRLHQRVIGQHEAVHAVSRAIRRNRAGFRKKKKPSSFLFVGPTGVGKTELVRALAQELFGQEDAMIRMDMSEYMEKHTVSKLIGSPPGYVGFDDGGQLTEKVRRKPYSVILMDEIEKAHPDVFNMLLQIMEDGRLTDSHGKTVSFENTVLILTSNAGTSLKAAGIGFGQDGQQAAGKIHEALKEVFRPEFMNRLDETVVFTPLKSEELAQIVDLMLETVSEDAREKEINLEVTPEARVLLREKGTDPRFGARPLRRTIQRMIEDELAERFLKGQVRTGQNVRVTREGDTLAFEVG